jgi:hypothetical protein
LSPGVGLYDLGEKKTQNLLKALDDIDHNAPINLNIRGFVKTEITLKGNVEYDPRLITSSHDTYNARMGPISYSLAKHLYDSFDIDDGVVFVTAMNKTQLGDLLKKTLDIVGRNAKIFVGDNSRHDAHTGHDYLMARFEKNAVILNGYDDEFLEYQLKTFDRKGKLRGSGLFVDCQYKASHPSGQNDTTDGNGFATLTGHDLNLSRWLDPFKLRKNKKMITWVSGDNFAHFFSDDLTWEELPRTINYDKHMKELGFECETEYHRVDTFYYCSNLFVPIGDTFVATQFPGKNLSKAYASYHNYTSKQAKYWVNSTAKAYRQDYNHVSFMANFHENVLQCVYDAVKTPLQLMSEYETFYKHVQFKHTADIVTDNWLKQRYGDITIQWPTTLKTLHSFCNTSSIVAHIVERDTGPQRTKLDGSAAPKPLCVPVVTLKTYFGKPVLHRATLSTLIGKTKRDIINYYKLEKQFKLDNLIDFPDSCNLNKTFLGTQVVANEDAKDPFERKPPTAPPLDIFDGCVVDHDLLLPPPPNDTQLPNNSELDYYLGVNLDNDCIEMTQIIDDKNINKIPLSISNVFDVTIKPIIYQTEYYKREIILNSTNTLYLFGDNYTDKHRGHGVERLAWQNQARQCGEFDRQQCYGIVTIYPSHNQFVADLLQAKKDLVHHYKNGVQIIVPAPNALDLKLHHDKFFQGATQFIKHNLGTGIANLGFNDLYLIQQMLHEVEITFLQ